MTSSKEQSEAGYSPGERPRQGGRAVVLDSSALLCLLNGEVGSDRVAEVLPSAVIGAVNLAEVVTKLREKGLTAKEADEALDGLQLDVRSFTAAQATSTGHLRPATRALGLSLGDRACIALAAELGGIAITADRDWAKVEDGVTIEVLR